MIAKGPRRGSRRGLALLGAAALAGLGQLAVTTAALAAPVIGCAAMAELDFTPNGPGSSSGFSWTMSGLVGGCTSIASGTPGEALVTVGRTLTVSVPITLADGQVVQGTATYQEPAGDGGATFPANSCASSLLFDPNAFFQWPDGTITQTNLSVITLGGVAQFQGAVETGAVLPLIPGTESPSGTAPDTYVVFSDNPAFDQAEQFSGVAAVTRADALSCTSATGVQEADVAGALQFGENLNILRP